ncbi:MAG: ParA family protein [Candidatus Heimdallarchaeaceae archaeon]
MSVELKEADSKRNLPTLDLKVVMFHSQKGGTGKSTLSSNVAYALAEKGYKTVLIDLDIAQPSIRHIFNIPSNVVEVTINDVLFGHHEIESALIQHPENSDLFLIVGEDKITIGDEMLSIIEHVKQDSFFFFHESVKNLHLIGIDYVIFDCAPGYRTESVNASIITDARVLVIRPNTFSFFGAKQMIKTFYNKLYTRTVNFFVFNQVPSMEKDNISKLLQDWRDELIKMSRPFPLGFLGFFPFATDLNEKSVFGDYIVPKDHPIKENLYRLIDILDEEIENRRRVAELGDFEPF